MNLFKAIWGLFFRLFPCPMQTGLMQAGNPGPSSPVLVTCNFYITVRRLLKMLRKKNVDAWIVVADSKGVNVWCAAGGGEFDTQSVVSTVKTCGVAEKVHHRDLVLPPLGAPAIVARDVAKQTGWKTHWGPVYMNDLPGFLSSGMKRDENMKRTRYLWRERLDTAMGSLFPFFFLGAIVFALFFQTLLPAYLILGVASFLLFFLACPYLSGKRGLTKVLWLEVPLAAILLITELISSDGSPLRTELILTMVMLFLVSMELGGLSSTMASDLDPFLARLGIGGIGNAAFAGSIRTDLLNGNRILSHDPELCNSCGVCVEVCPQLVWEKGDKGRSVLANAKACTACRACLTQCPTGAAQAPLNK